MRIAVGGFQHETNTFAPSKADFDAFARGGGWPPLLQADDVFDGTAGINLPIAGAVAALRRAGHALVPTAWAAASPSAHVTRDAFERIVSLIVEPLRRAGHVDGVYLDLHGAMVTEHLDDGEGELLSRVRAVVGDRVPLVASLDLHANVTAAMLRHADALVAYRTYPHVDMAETGERAAALLQRRLDGERRPVVAARRVPFLIPLGSQCTMMDPMASVYASLPRLENRHVTSVSFASGFPAADFPECGPVVLAWGDEGEAVARAADAMLQQVAEREPLFEVDVLSPEDGVRQAMAIASHASRPVVIADTQDNPGAGGNSDTTGMLRALVAANAQRASLGLIADPECARAAHAAGEGAVMEIGLGGNSRIPGDSPFFGRFAVERLSDGRFTCTGPFYRGARMNIGLSACLRIGGVRVIVSCEKPQLADQEMYRFIGIEPTREAILVNKSSVHFRADFAPIAERILVCKAPGPMLADPGDLPWQRLARGMRVSPMGTPFQHG
ncbi:MAG: M81 family metallopeptidase [Betaproteobacteria bacterium]|nr:M81 family metallopeptidase [Betaproteobacteria bacterium]